MPVAPAEKKLSPAAGAAFVAARSTLVGVSDAGVDDAARLLAGAVEDGFGVASWAEQPLHPKVDPGDAESVEAAVNWIFFVDCLNFSFWSEADPDRRYAVEFEGERYTGYWSLCAAVNRALKSGLALTDPRVYADITEDQLRDVFRSETDESIPLFEERLAILRESGRTLISEFAGSFLTAVAAANGSAQGLVELLVRRFPSFRDEAAYEGQTVCFYKRAQILVADLWGCFQGTGPGAFSDISSVTMFADYRVPQALAFLGAIRYSQEAKDRLSQAQLLHSGDRLEVEIRGCSIHACELIRERANALLRERRRTRRSATTPEGGDGADDELNSVLVDFFLWTWCKERADLVAHVPVHRIRCVYY